jgi:hypothetical protein
MAQQTKGASNRPNSAASSRRRSSSNGRSGSRAKPQSSATRQSTARSLASKLKTPAIAGGAAVAGLAGGLALAGRGSHRKLLGVPLPTATKTQATSRNLAEAAKQIGSFGERVGELATEVRMVREGAAQDHSPSPIEVVLQGLTSRRT